MINLEEEIKEAEENAWKSLRGYKFMMFGYWCAIWVHLNRLDNVKRRNPFKPLVDLADEMVEDRK